MEDPTEKTKKRLEALSKLNLQDCQHWIMERLITGGADCVFGSVHVPEEKNSRGLFELVDCGLVDYDGFCEDGAWVKLTDYGKSIIDDLSGIRR